MRCEPQFPWRTGLASALLIGLVSLPALMSASAQIVVPEVKRWTAAECRWLHSQALVHCRNHLPDCSNMDDLAMAIQRGLNALDNVLTARERQQFDAICYNVCMSKTLPSYQSFNADFCAKIKAR
jgi:hypothetical protein